MCVYIDLCIYHNLQTVTTPMLSHDTVCFFQVGDKVSSIHRWFLK